MSRPAIQPVKCLVNTQRSVDLNCNITPTPVDTCDDKERLGGMTIYHQVCISKNGPTYKRSHELHDTPFAQEFFQAPGAPGEVTLNTVSLCLLQSLIQHQSLYGVPADGPRDLRGYENLLAGNLGFVRGFSRILFSSAKSDPPRIHCD